MDKFKMMTIILIKYLMSQWKGCIWTIYLETLLHNHSLLMQCLPVGILGSLFQIFRSKIRIASTIVTSMILLQDNLMLRPFHLMHKRKDRLYCKTYASSERFFGA